MRKEKNGGLKKEIKKVLNRSERIEHGGDQRERARDPGVPARSKNEMIFFFPWIKVNSISIFSLEYRREEEKKKKRGKKVGAFSCGEDGRERCTLWPPCHPPPTTPPILPFPPPSTLHLLLYWTASGAAGGFQSFSIRRSRHVSSISATIRPQMSRPNKACCIVKTNKKK